MNLIRSALREAKTLWLESFYRKPVAIALDKPVVSMTFDDVPLSAYEYALPILDDLSVRATFYVSLNIDKDPNQQQFLGPREILELHNQGHEIACHTFTHYSLAKGDADGLAHDAEQNRAELSKLLGGNGPQSFSFPFGELSLAAKKKLRGKYQSLRTSRPGINHGSTDLNCLKAYSLGAGSSAQRYISELLRKAELNNGWLILYSHGVSHRASPFDIRPETLENILQECQRRHVEVLPVVRVLELIGSI